MSRRLLAQTLCQVARFVDDGHHLVADLQRVVGGLAVEQPREMILAPPGLATKRPGANVGARVPANTQCGVYR
jgi:hypothetical protein